MAFQRGTYGIEYRPEGPSEETPWLIWAIGIAVFVALIYGTISAYRAIHRWATERPAAEVPRNDAAKAVAEPDVSAQKVVVVDERPRKVRNLLMKLDAAIASTNYPVQIATIEELRSLPGAPVADLDDTLARSLGRLNLRMLFGAGRKNEWVKTITVKRGDSAHRVASEHGTTVKCLEKLNGDVSSLRIGQSLRVMNHPQFRLSVYRKTRVADLSLNGKFFKRYYFTGDVVAGNGSYTFPVKTRSFLAENGMKMSDADLAELEMLLPKGANMTIADFR